jgi:hypothetical protein
VSAGLALAEAAAASARAAVLLALAVRLVPATGVLEALLSTIAAAISAPALGFSRLIAAGAVVALADAAIAATAVAAGLVIA